MTHWSYMHSETGAAPSEAFLDKMGAAGWELVSVVYREYGGQTFGKSAWHCFFKRPSDEASK